MRLRLVGVAILAAGAAVAGPRVPRAAGEFAVSLPGGGRVLLSSLRGKVVCLEFIDTTCPHCQHVSQTMSKLAGEYGARGFQPVAAAFNEGAPELVAEFKAKYRVAYPVGYADRDAVLDYLRVKVGQRFVVPQMIWIDREGRIRAQTPAKGDERTLEESYFRGMIEKLLSEGGLNPNTLRKGFLPIHDS